MSPVFIAPELGPWPLHDAGTSRAAEAAALATAAPHELMQRAGLGVAQLVLALAPHAQRIDVVSGPGNNGGDGLVAATCLHRAGKDVRVALLGNPDRRPADAADALRAALDGGVRITPHWEDGPSEFVVDALLGLGTRRAPDGAIADAIRRMNGTPASVLAVDLPSGLHSDTGTPLGEQAVRATATLSLLTLKPGLFTGQGRDHTGAVWLDTLGVRAGPASAELSGPPAWAARMHGTHKGSYGDLAVVGGAPGMTGAAWLAARAALAAGAGRVYCSLLDEQASLLDALRPELMGRTGWWLSPPAVLAASTVVCGCGGGDAVRAVLPPLLSHAARLLLDADALNAIAADPALQKMLLARAGRGRGTTLTPHPLEAARLLAISAGEVQADRLAAAQALAERFGAVVVLKGSGSVIAAPGVRPTINSTGNALLATAGTGDVLAGWTAGSWAQHDDARAVAVAAAWQHGRAADLAAAAGQRTPLRAADLIEVMRGV
jgi:ADP-dependent NAD(P)H-hydrate dehydratase / NAD(P)H-hydrate epimerase